MPKSKMHIHGILAPKKLEDLIASVLLAILKTMLSMVFPSLGSRPPAARQVEAAQRLLSEKVHFVQFEVPREAASTILSERGLVRHEIDPQLMSSCFRIYLSFVMLCFLEMI